MSKITDFVNNFLSHYQSEFYDPVKAHEYYLKTRQLQGRRSGSALKTESKKEAWAYTKTQIENAKKAELAKASVDEKAQVEQLRSTATSRRKDLSKKLSLLLQKVTENRQHDAEDISKKQKAETEKISAQLKKEMEQVAQKHKKQAEALAEKHQINLQKISDQASAKIAALPPVPKGLSDEKRAELAAERSEKIAKIRGDATKDRKTLSGAIKVESNLLSAQTDKERKSLTDKANSEKEAVLKQTQGKREALSKFSTADKTKHRERANKEREAIGSELKTAVDSGRAKYETLKENLKAKYETALNTEFEAIKNNV